MTRKKHTLHGHCLGIDDIKKTRRNNQSINNLGNIFQTSEKYYVHFALNAHI